MIRAAFDLAALAAFLFFVAMVATAMGA